MVISLIFIVLLRFLAGIMVWVMIVLVILVIGYGTSGFKMFFFLTKNYGIYMIFPPKISLGIFHCYMEFANLKGQPGSDVTIRDLGLQTDFAVYLQIRQTWLAFSMD